MARLHLFLLVLLTVLITHTWLWQAIPLVDREGWSVRLETLSRGELELFMIPFFANPDMAVLSVGAFARTIGAPVFGALTGSLVLLTAIGIASIVTLAHILRPQTYWWLVTSVVLIANDAYVESTPHDVIAALYIVISYLIGLYLYENRSATYWWLVSLGLVSGVVMATYVPMGLLFLLPLTIFLVSFLSPLAMSIYIVFTLLSWLLFDPLWLFMPFTHGNMIMSQTLTHATAFIPSSLPLIDFLVVAPLPLLGFFLAVLHAVLSRQLGEILPRRYLVLLLSTSVLVAVLLLSARYKTFRSFHPLIFLWGTFLPLFFLDLVRKFLMRYSISPTIAVRLGPAIFLSTCQLMLFGISIYKVL